MPESGLPVKINPTRFVVDDRAKTAIMKRLATHMAFIGKLEYST
jgi:hypothetical protein